jgi:hypothetical protein
MAKKPSPPRPPDPPAGEPHNEVVYWDFTPEKPVRDIDNDWRDLAGRTTLAAPATAEERKQLDRQEQVAHRRWYWFERVRTGNLVSFRSRDPARVKRSKPWSDGDVLMFAQVIGAVHAMNPDLSAERLLVYLRANVGIGGLNCRRDIVRDLLDLRGDMPPGHYRLRPEALTVQGNAAALLSAPRSTWARWLGTQGLPIPPDLQQGIIEEPVQPGMPEPRRAPAVSPTTPPEAPPSRDEAIRQRLEAGVIPGKNERWKEFEKQIRTACKVVGKTTGFGKRTLQERVKQLRGF